MVDCGAFNENAHCQACVDVGNDESRCKHAGGSCGVCRMNACMGSKSCSDAGGGACVSNKCSNDQTDGIPACCADPRLSPHHEKPTCAGGLIPTKIEGMCGVGSNLETAKYKCCERSAALFVMSQISLEI